MNAEQLIAAALASRAKWVDLEGGRRVRVRRPAEHDVRSLLQRDAAGAVIGLAADLPEAIRYVVGWEGFTEADLLGPEIGAGDVKVPFDPEVWEAVSADSTDYQRKVADAILKSVVDYLNSKAETSKNSKPGQLREAEAIARIMHVCLPQKPVSRPAVDQV